MAQALLVNLKAVQETIDKNKPSGAKGKYWLSLYVCSSMGPSLKVDIDSLGKLPDASVLAEEGAKEAVAA